jgi:hypothetical protein
MNSVFRLLAITATFLLTVPAAASTSIHQTGEICFAPFHATPPLPSLPGRPPLPPPPGEASLSDTTWEPSYQSHFTFFVDGQKKATLGNSEMVHLTGLRTDKPVRIRVQLDGRPFESFRLDLAKSDHRICLWLYPGYCHWINEGWDPKLGCNCDEEPKPTPTPSKHGA